MGRLHAGELGLLPVLGCLAWVSAGVASGDGRVFLLEPRSGLDRGFEASVDACSAQGARVASAVELRHAVVECAFSACARGWLTGPSIGMTVCRSVAGSLRAVDMQVENVTETSEKLPAFCVKDTGAPCGGPPSFPNTRLQGQTGLELGDELLYACSPGYTLPNGETAFSLLCDSCGEWYGLVQLCVKDNVEAFIDYEDKLPEEHHLYSSLEEVHHVSLRPDTEHDEESTVEPEQDVTVKVEEEEDKGKEDPAVPATEPPVSQLSQKHMFWFPSEAFHEEEHPAVLTDAPIKGVSHDDVPVKNDDSHLEPEPTTEGHDGEHVTPSPTDEPASRSVGGTEESWLDGYPVSQEEDRAGAGSTEEAGPGDGVATETGTGSSKDVEFESVTGRPEDTSVVRVIHSHEESKTGGVSETSKGGTDGEDVETEGGTTSPEGNSYGAGFDIHEEVFQGVTDEPHGKMMTEFSEDARFVIERPEGEFKRPVETEFEDGTDMSKGTWFHGVSDRPNDVEMSPTSFDDITRITTGLDDVYTPAYAPENVSSSQEEMGFEHTATPSGMAPLDTTPASSVHIIGDVATPTNGVSWESKDNSHFLDKGMLDETRDNQSAMESDKGRSRDRQERGDDGDCGADPCRVGGRGPVIAAIVIGIIAAVVGVALGVWCYKRRQQKSSHYQLNGTNRQTQCIELQQTV